MASTVADILNAIAPTFNASPNAATFLDMAYQQTDAGYFGANYSMAVAYRAAHMFAMSSRGSNEAGMLTGKHMGPVSVSFQAAGGGSNSDLELTTYGKSLLDLIKSSSPAISCVGNLTTFLSRG
jgi:hypothetical protein